MRLLIAKLASASVQSVSIALNSETDVADLATDLDNCVRMLRSGGYDLVLLIVSPTRLRPRDAIARLRRENGHVPMVVLTEPDTTDGSLGPGPSASRAAPEDATESPPAGEQAAAPWMWDDPPPLPGGFGRPGGGVAAGPRRVSLDTQGEMLRIDDHPVGLSQAEFRIFARLWEQRGRIVSAEELMTAIYGSGERPASRVLPVFLFKLRRKLSALGLGDLVETAIGRGFTIRADTEGAVEATPAN
jgi:DNA-binding response OmpR family regulator